MSTTCVFDAPQACKTYTPKHKTHNRLDRPITNTCMHVTLHAWLPRLLLQQTLLGLEPRASKDASRCARLTLLAYTNGLQIQHANTLFMVFLTPSYTKLLEGEMVTTG